MVCLLAAPWVQLSVSADNGLPHNALRHHWLMPISCHFRDCKALLVTSLTHVSGATARLSRPLALPLPSHRESVTVKRQEKIYEIGMSLVVAERQTVRSTTGRQMVESSSSRGTL